MITGVSNLQYGAGGLLAIILLAIVFGILVPRWVVNQIIKGRDQTIAEKDKQLAAKDREIELWRETAENYMKVASKTVGFSENLIGVSEVTTKALHALTASAHQGEPNEVAQVSAPSQG